MYYYYVVSQFSIKGLRKWATYWYDLGLVSLRNVKVSITLLARTDITFMPYKELSYFLFVFLANTFYPNVNK